MAYLCGLLVWLWRKWTFSGSKQWPLTSGEVYGYQQGGHDVETRPWSVRNAPITLIYSYTVNNEYQWGEIVLPKRLAPNVAKAREVFPVGTSIEVHYSPNKPELSRVLLH